MTDQENLDTTDMGTYLGKIAARLLKEGSSLQALAGIWYEKGDDNLNIVVMHLALVVFSDLSEFNDLICLIDCKWQEKLNYLLIQ